MPGERSSRILVLSVAGELAFGAERILAEFLEALPDDFAGTCLLLRPVGSRLARWAAGGRVRHWDWPARRDAAVFNLLACFRAARELRAERIGLVHAWGTRAFEAALLLGRLLGAPVCGTLHDHPRASFLTGLRMALLHRSAPRLRPLVCVSRAVATACRDAGLNADCVVIRNGLLPAPVPSDRRRHGPTRVGFFGLYARWKGFETVRQWIHEAGPGIEWHLYGEPAPVFRAMCEELKAKRLPNVIFHGWVDGSHRLGGIDVLLQTSIEFDPYPTVLLEAARAGLATVASSVGGTGEIVEDGVTGLLFSPSEPAVGLRHLELLASDADLRARMGAAARRRFESEFGIARMVDEYLRLWSTKLRVSLSAGC